MSPSEVRWLRALLRKLPASELRDMVRSPAYTSLGNKIANMEKSAQD